MIQTLSKTSKYRLKQNFNIKSLIIEDYLESNKDS